MSGGEGSSWFCRLDHTAGTAVVAEAEAVAVAAVVVAVAVVVVVVEVVMAVGVGVGVVEIVGVGVVEEAWDPANVDWKDHVKGVRGVKGVVVRRKNQDGNSLLCTKCCVSPHNVRDNTTGQSLPGFTFFPR